MGEAVGFTGTGAQRVTFANGGALFDGWQVFTLSFWLYADYSGPGDLGGTEPGVMDKGTSLTLGRIYASGPNLRFQVDLHFDSTVVYAYLVSLPPKTWTLVTITSDGNTLSIGRDANPYGSADLSPTGESLRTSTMPFYLGDTTNVFKGRIDELRIERRYRPNDYARAQYLSMTRQFVTFTDP
jgi:hypothetical protein